GSRTPGGRAVRALAHVTKVSVANRPSGGKVDTTAGVHGPAGRKASAVTDHRHRIAEHTREPP
uniref:hypothetical protein n=1 Tax=Streptomyces scabiei TaxID=1930 RepID=UPI001968C56B